MIWQPIATAPKDGTAMLGFGIHVESPADAQRGVKAGDYWWAIMVWDIWRTKVQWVFSKDGKPTWSIPTHWMPLPPVPVTDIHSLDCTTLVEREGWDCATCGHRHAGRTLGNICIGCHCPETIPASVEDLWIRIASQNAEDANARMAVAQAEIARLTAALSSANQAYAKLGVKRIMEVGGLFEAFEVLRGHLVRFNERTQEFFCTVCRYRDPLGPDGNQLHDDNCVLLAALALAERSDTLPSVEAVDSAAGQQTPRA